MSSWRLPAILFGIGFAVFAGTAGARLTGQSADPHFVYLADAWLHGRLSITDPPPQKGDDWAVVETVRLADGREVRGRRLKTRPYFQVAGGGEIPITAVTQSLGKTHYVSFPPFPTVLLLPQAAVHGRAANDVVLTVLIAAAVLPLMFLALRRAGAIAAAAGERPAAPSDHLWLTAALGFGSVFYFSAVQGRVWYTAHVVGVALCLAYILCALGARRPVWAGIFLGLATLTRVPLAFLFPLFAFEAWRVAGGRTGQRQFARLCLRFAVPVLVIAAVAMVHNQVRFADPFEFGHSYLDVRQQALMERFGKFNGLYLGRNLAVALTLLPSLSSAPPHVFISGHGLAMWITTPLLLVLLWPARRGPLWRGLLVTALAVAVPSLLYMNSGWLQFGYRFSLDYLPLLLLAIAVSARPLGRTGRALIAVGIAVNLFGAVTFPSPVYYDYRHYDTVVNNAPLWP
jgi:hypothetical protein